jgi:stage V sporulation protein R
MLISEYISQDFVDENKLFVAGRRLDEQRMIWQYYVKSRKAEDYREMVQQSLYHPPSIEFEVVKNNHLHLKHLFEGKPLVRDYIAGTMLGIEYLWGGPVILDTFEPVQQKASADPDGQDKKEKPRQEFSWKQFRYTMRNRQLSREEHP